MTSSPSKETPESVIEGFHQDDEGHWVADLKCGHTQHMRHRPPWEERPWVMTEAGRASMVEQSVPCPLCLMPKLPPDVAEYKRTGVFDETTVPKGLLKRHSLRKDAWGEIVILEGRVKYVLEDDDDRTFVLRPGVPGAVAPERPHHIEPEAGARFFIRFLR